MNAMLTKFGLGSGVSEATTQALVDVIGWSLLHSLWQGTIIAVLCACALRLLAQADARRLPRMGRAAGTGPQAAGCRQRQPRWCPCRLSCAT